MYFSKAVDADFFKTWNSDMAYILGFLYADGNVTKNTRGGEYLSFYSADRGILADMRKKMKSKHKLSKRSTLTGCVYRIQIGSKEIVSDLSKIGLRETKVYRMQFPSVPKEYIPDFIRGFFDGDGNVWVGRTHVNRIRTTIGIQAAFTSASREFLSELHIELRRLGIQGGSLFKIKGKQCGRLCLSIKDSLKLYEIMYNASTSLFLNRKKLVFEKYRKMQS
ncbi:MAG: hypothetical protein KA052_02535 [Candidatus Pacebacteria bacterium]|nr:hypothetical protein [Candidatus Paceibacterota bacterium]